MTRDQGETSCQLDSLVAVKVKALLLLLEFMHQLLLVRNTLRNYFTTGGKYKGSKRFYLNKKEYNSVSGSLSFILIHSLGLNILNLNLCVTLLSMYDCPSDCRIMVSRSHQGEVMKMAEKFKPPGVVTPAGGSGYKVTRSWTHIPPINSIFLFVVSF